MYKSVVLIFALAVFGYAQINGCDCTQVSLPPIGAGLSAADLNKVNKIKSDIINNALKNKGSLDVDFSGISVLSNNGNIGSIGNVGGAETQYVIRSALGNVFDISQTKPTDGIIYPFHGGPNQRFTITNDGISSIIRCVQNNGVVKSSPQGKINTSPLAGTPNERWIIKRAFDPKNPNLFIITNVADGNCFDLKNGSTANDNDVINTCCTGKSNQLWQIIPITPGSKVIPTNYVPYCG